MQQAEEMSVGAPMIDMGRRELLHRLEHLRAAISKEVCRYTIENTIAFLEEYTETVFCEEEQYMKYYGYPEFASHREQHERFVTELIFLQEELRNIRTLGLKGSYELSVETVKVIVDWVSGHVADDDRRLRDFLSQQPDIDFPKLWPECRADDDPGENFIMVCSICRKIRSKRGTWKAKEHYRRIPPDVACSHGICPECLQMHYADLFQGKK